MVGPAVLLFGLLLAGAARTEQPVCNAFTEGAAACLGNKQCLCRFDPGGTVTARPSGYRWNCGVLRPACELPPPSLPAPPLPNIPFLPQYGDPQYGDQQYGDQRQPSPSQPNPSPPYPPQRWR